MAHAHAAHVQGVRGEDDHLVMSMFDFTSRLRKVEARVLPRTTESFAKYIKDPISYVHEVLGIRILTPAQKEILQYVADNYLCRLLIPSGNETGKSFIIACILNWHYDCFRPSLTYVTAPSKAQVDEVVFRQLRMMRKDKRGFSPKASTLSDDPSHLCKGYTAANETAFQGRHEGNVLVACDEAEELSEELLRAASSFANRLICTYNPTLASSAVAIAERNPTWKVIRLNCLDHPNIRAAEDHRPPPIPNAITMDKLLSRLSEWRSTRITDPNEPMSVNDVVVMGQRWRLSPICEARILGRRPGRSSDAVFGVALLDQLRQRNLVKKPFPHWKVQIGCDVARYGDDFTVMHVRQGCCSLHHETHNGWDTKQTAQRLRDLVIKFAGHGQELPENVPVVIDDTGVGGGVVDQGNGFNFIGVNASNRPDIGHENNYPNLRSQIAWDLESLLYQCMVDMSRLGDDQIHDICEQLSVMTYELGPRGVRIVHPKKLIKEKLGRSPDDADAVMLAYYQFPVTQEVHK